MDAEGREWLGLHTCRIIVHHTEKPKSILIIYRGDLEHNEMSKKAQPYFLGPQDNARYFDDGGCRYYLVSILRRVAAWGNTRMEKLGTDSCPGCVCVCPTNR